MNDEQMLALGLILAILGINWIMPKNDGSPGRLVQMWNAAWTGSTSSGSSSSAGAANAAQTGANAYGATGVNPSVPDLPGDWSAPGSGIGQSYQGGVDNPGPTGSIFPIRNQ